MEQKSTHRKLQRSFCFSTLFFVVVILFASSTSAATDKPADYVFVGMQSGVTEVTSDKGKVLFQSPQPHEAIEWAMTHSSITVVTEGTYRITCAVENRRFGTRRSHEKNALSGPMVANCTAPSPSNRSMAD